MAKIKLQKQVRELVLSGQRMADQQWSNTLTQELEAKRNLLLRLPISEIQRIRDEYQEAQIAKQIFQVSKYTCVAAGLIELPPTLRMASLDQERIMVKGNWDVINDDLMTLLNADIQISRDELCRLILDVVIKEEKCASALRQAIEAAEKVCAGRRAESQYNGAAGLGSATTYWDSDSSGAGETDGLSSRKKERNHRH